MSPTPRTPTRKSAPRNSMRSRKTPLTAAHDRELTAFESFAETTSAAILIIQGRRILYANPAATRITGYRSEELLEMELWQLAHPNYQQTLKRPEKAQAWAEHLPSRFEIKIVTKGGEARWLDVTLGNIDYRGQSAIAMTAFDITERDQAERELRQAHAELEARVHERTIELATANEKFQSVLSTITEAYMAFDSDWRFVAINPCAERNIFGRPASELIGKVIWDEYPQTVGGEVYAQYQLALETERPTHFEMPSRIAPGHWFEVHAYPRGNGLEVYSRDITERKQAEEEIASLARFPGENPNPVLRLSQTGEVWYSNAAGQTLLQTWAGTTGDVALSYWRKLAAEAIASRVDKTVDLECEDRAYSFFVAPIVEAGYVNLYGQDVTEHKQAEEALRESEARFRALFETMTEGFSLGEIICDDAGKPYDLRYLVVNPAFERQTGLKATDILGHTTLELFPQTEPEWFERYGKVALTGEPAHFEAWFGPLGQYFEVSAYQTEPGRCAVVFFDVTKLYKLNRALRAVSDSNQAMMRADDEAEYLKEVCKIVVKDCGHTMIWIGFAEQDEGKTVRPVAHAGFEEGYLETLKVTWANTERGRGPTGTAIRTGKPSGCSNMLTDPNFVPWRAEALKRGYASSIALPIIANERTFGAVTIYSRTPHAFSEDEINLLNELAADLAHGISILRLRVAHTQAVEALRLSEERYRSLFTGMTEGFALHEIICDEQGAPCDYRFLEINPAFERLTGLKRENVIGRTVNEVLPNDDPRWLKMYGQVALTGQPIHFENYSPALQQHYEVYAYRPQPRQFAVLFMNITERKRMEEALHESEQRFRVIASSTPDHLLVQDRNLQYTLVINPQMGLTAQDMLGKTDHEFLSKEDADKLTQIKQQVLETGSPVQLETSLISAQGELEYFDGTYVPTFNTQNQVDGLIGYFRNATERKHMEEALRRARDELEIRVQERTEELLALSNAERDQRQLAETLTAANSALTQSLNLETVLETLLDYVARLVPYDSANVMLLESEARLAVRVARGYERWSSAELVRALTFDAQATPVLNTLLTTRRSCLVPDTGLEPGWQTPPGAEHVRSWLGVPLMAGGNVIGLYSLDKAEPGFFTTEHVRLAEMLVGQAAVAIQNAWLFEQVHAGRERLQALSRRLVEAQEAERHYVARELHDEAGQALTSLLFKLGQLEQQTTDLRQADQVAELKQMTNGVLESLHRLAMDLRPASLDHLGLVPALLQYVKAIGDRYGVIAQFKAVGFEGERLPADVETALYRIVQEALTNTVRHAQAAHADVLLERRGDRVVVVIEDDGLGFDADVARFAQQGHLGLAGMQERAEMLGGSLVIESAVGAGTTIVVEVPHDHSHFDR